MSDADAKGRDSSPDARVLRELVRDAQRAPLPEIDWDRLESRLFGEIEDGRAGPEEVRPSQLPALPAEVASVAPPAAELEPARLAKPAPQAPRRGFGRWVAALAVAAGLAGLFARDRAQTADAPVAVREPVDLMALPAAPGMGPARDLGALKDGDVVEATVGPVAFGQDGGLSWTLAAGSRVTIHGDSDADRVVELESGSIHGVVEKGSGLRFVVMAGDTEIVSFGEDARFSVTRSSKQLVVDMERGSAQVSGRDGASRLRQIDAPLLASVSLDGGLRFEILREERELIAQAPVAPAPTAPHAAPANKPVEVVAPGPAPATTGAPSAAVASAAPATSAAAPAAGPMSEAAAAAGVRSCLNEARAKRAASSDGISISVDSTLRLTVGDEGVVKGAAFNPPLRPELQSCAVFLLRAKLDGGARVVEIPIHLK